MGDPLAWLDDAPPAAPARKSHPRPPAPDPLAWLDEAEAAPPVDVGPTARAARGGGSPSGPRDISAEDAGTVAGPIAMRSPIDPGMRRGPMMASQAPAPADAPEEDYVTRRPLPGGGTRILAQRGNPNEMGDPGAQLMTAGAIGSGTGMVAAELGAPGVVASAAEGAVANKTQGGDLSTGAALSLIPNVVPAARAVARAARSPLNTAAGAIARPIATVAPSVMRSAPARVDQSAARAALGEGAETQAKTKTGNIVAATEPERLREVFSRNEDLRADLHHGSARSNPERAHGATSTVIHRADARLDRDYARMDDHLASGAATEKTSLGDVFKGFDGVQQAYRTAGEFKKVAAVEKAKQFFRDSIGDDATLITPTQLRGMKRELGDVAYAGDTTTPRSVKQQVGADLYGPVAIHIERMAKATPGVNVPRFMADNADVSTLIPIRDALNERAVAARAGRGRKLMEAAKAIGSGGVAAALGHLTGIPLAEAGAVGVTAYGATKLGMAVSRRVDYKLAQLAERAQRGPLPRVMLDDAARSGVPPALLLQLAQRAGVQEEAPR